MTYALKGINAEYALKDISPGDTFRRTAGTLDAVAISEHKAATLTLLARAAERFALGTLCEDEAEALIRLMRG